MVSGLCNIAVINYLLICHIHRTDRIDRDRTFAWRELVHTNVPRDDRLIRKISEKGFQMIKAKRAGAVLCCLAIFLANSAFAAGPVTPAGDDPSTDSLAELQRLKSQVDEQQNQLQEQQKQIEILKT